MRCAIVMMMAIVSLSPFPVTAACLNSEDTNSHVGERTCVCGTIVSTQYASRSEGQPTFLNFDRPYPDQRFTAIIYGEDRAKFGEPERTFRGRHTCVTGEIKLYRQKPEMVVQSPDQLSQ